MNQKLKCEKIIFFHPQNNYTGSTRVLANIIEQNYNNSEVTVICNDENKRGFLSELENVHIIPIPQLKLRGRDIRGVTYMFSMLYGMYLAFSHSTNVSCFYINTLVPMYAAIVAKFLKKKIIYHIHEKYVQLNIIGKFEEYVFNHSNAHRIYVSNYVCGKYNKNLNCTEEIKYNTLPQSYLNGVKITPIDKRSRNRILMIASLSPKKGIDTFIEVAAKLPDYNFTLILSTDEESIKSYFDNIIPKNIQIISARHDIRSYMENADLILNLSNPLLCIETFGMTILEAMPYAIPSIAPNIGGPTELIIDGYNGKLVDTTNIHDIINAIRAILLDGKIYETYCNNVLKVFKNKFNK